MYSNVDRSRMCQGTLGPNGPIARGYAQHTPNITPLSKKGMSA